MTFIFLIESMPRIQYKSFTISNKVKQIDENKINYYYNVNDREYSCTLIGNKNNVLKLYKIIFYDDNMPNNCQVLKLDSSLNIFLIVFLIFYIALMINFIKIIKKYNKIFKLIKNR